MLKRYTQSVVSQIERDHGSLNSEKRFEMYLSGLSEEVGEVQGLRKRQIRRNSRDFLKWSDDGKPLTEEAFEKALLENYVDELGDVLWYVVALCKELGISLEELIEHNEKKLGERYGF